MTPEVLRKKQMVLLEIVKDVAEICGKHDLRYYAISGTLIGAVRHKGFVPWDDDVDIAMPRDDLNRFIEIAPAELPDHLGLLDPAAVRHMRVTFIKVHDKRTTHITKDVMKYPDRYCGVDIDIMPLDGLPAPGFKRKAVLSVLQLLRALNIHKRISFSKEERRRWPKLRRVFNALFMPFRIIFPSAFYYKLFNAILSRFPFDSSDHVYFSWLPNDQMRIFNKAPFESVTRLDFEGFPICAPAGYHEYLTGDYGDYMTPPPEEYRRTPHDEGGILDLERSYRDYLEDRGA